MGFQQLLHLTYHQNTHLPLLPSIISISASSSSSSSSSNLSKIQSRKPDSFRPTTPLDLTGTWTNLGIASGRYSGSVVVRTGAAGNVATQWDSWMPEKGSKAPSFSDIFWPSAGAFVGMAVLGKMDQMLTKKGLSMTIAPLGAVCALLFATPSSPGARKYNMFMAQMGCAAIGVLAFTLFGPGWLARSVGLSAALAFMIYTRSVHPPAASLPLLFIDGAKLHHLKFWYALFPGAAGCLILCFIQQVVCYLKDNVKF